MTGCAKRRPSSIEAPRRSWICCRTDLSLTRYRSILEALYGYYLPLEARLQPAAAIGFPLSSRSPRLERDLTALGASTTGLPRCDELPSVESAADLAGCLYVIEGAALGGRVIAKALDRHLGIGPETGASFFAGDGSGTAARWTQVLAWIEDLAAARGCSDRIVEAACETFRTFTRWIGQKV